MMLLSKESLPVDDSDSLVWVSTSQGVCPRVIAKALILRAFVVLSVLNYSLLFRVILVIFVPYFYPGANFGVNFRGLDRRLWC